MFPVDFNMALFFLTITNFIPLPLLSPFFASSFPVTDKLVEPILDGDTLESLIQEKRLFIADFAVMEGNSTVKVCEKPLEVTKKTSSQSMQ